MYPISERIGNMQTNDLHAVKKRLRIQQGVITLVSMAMIVFVLWWLVTTALTGKKHGLNIKLPAFSKDESSSQSDSTPDTDSSEVSAVTPVDSSAADFLELVPSDALTSSAADGDTDYEGAALKDDFSDACFIGDSRTVGLELNSDKPKGSFFANTGLNVSSAMTDTVCKLSNGNFGTVIDAAGERKFHRVFVMFGINELGWPYPDVFEENYIELLNQIKAAQPDAEIYVESILPVSPLAAEENEVFTNENIDRFNEYIKQAAAKVGVNYLDVNSYFKDENGQLPDEAATDGIHFTRDYCLKWIDLLAYLVPQKEPMTIASVPAQTTPADSSSEETYDGGYDNDTYDNGGYYDGGYGYDNNTGYDNGYDNGYTDNGYDNGYTDYNDGGYTDYNYGY